jgi:hypothetical protein
MSRCSTPVVRVVVEVASGSVAGSQFARRNALGFVWSMTILALGFLVSQAHSQPPCPPAPPPYQSLRYDEEYTLLHNPSCRTDVWDPLKYMPLNETGDWFLSLGGEARLRYEYFQNTQWGQGPQDDGGFLLQRYLVHADFHLDPYARFFVQLQSSLENGRNGGPRPTDEDALDLHQAFVDVGGAFGTQASLTLRAGRQELQYGSQRLVSPREGPNVRLSFDAVRLIARAGPWRIDGFVSRPVETDPGVFDDNPDETRALWGVYAVAPLSPLPQGNTDLYYLGFEHEGARFDQGTADERRHTVGTRLWGRPEAWDYNVEFIYQWGSFGSGAIQAWAVSSDSGYTFQSALLRPRLGLRAELNSGDRDPQARTLQTFNALFPRGNYFGELALIGPANLADLHPSLDLKVTDRLSVTFDWDFFWRQSLHDGIYGPPGNLLRSGRTSRARYVGDQVAVQGEWRLGRHLTLVGVYTHFFAGPFVRETGPGRDIDYVSAWATYKF